ncbi:MAG TPA: Gfo/Idh/MocA family oxidoreductase [Tepidisphaeraceae bacterium]|jgi:predicted dehydrogenase|nr:Gfo/Idh/MocA family oxidoreductase [Tepidisphaeraceae bacterium]
MSRLSRRRFLKSSLAAAGAGVLINGTKATGNFFGANETIRVGVAGINGRGGSHIDAFGKMQDVKVAYLIDPDTRLFKSRGQRTEKADGEAPKMITDVRRVLDDKDVDAISVATPNHWHSLITIWACQAGKDVYVEKPCSHNIHEGRMAVETARRYKRIVQHGTQSRSSGGWEKVMAAIASGKLGKLLVARGLCYKPRGTIGFKETTTPPPEVDFNIWLGPAPQQPYHANLVHYNWHWFWDFGNGDIGNQGVHEMDKARWAIPGGTLPKSVISFGGRFGYEDQGQTPNTQVAIFDYGDTQLIFEVRGLKTGKYHNQQVGNVYHLEGGTIEGTKFIPKGKTEAAPLPVGEVKRGPGGGDHFRNFIEAMRTRKTDDLNADILEGHYSAALCHLANASYRLGQQAPFNAQTKAFGENKDAYDALERVQEHLKENAVALDGLTYRLGQKLTIDPQTEMTTSQEANVILKGTYRKPFTVPERVV